MAPETILPRRSGAGFFFALTLLIAGNYVLFSLATITIEQKWLIAADRNGFSPLFLRLIVIPKTGILIYYLALTVNFFARQTASRLAIWIGSVFLFLVLAVSALTIPQWGVAWSFLVLLSFVIVLHLGLCGKEWRWMFAAAAALAPGIALATLPIWYPFGFSVIKALRASGAPPVKILANTQRFFDILGCDWTPWVAIGMLLTLAGYLCLARFFAGRGGKSLRSMFAPPVVILLLAAAAFYLTFLTLVFFSRLEYARELAALERHFGRPVAADAWARLYYGDASGDQGYWEKIDGIHVRLDELKKGKYRIGEVTSARLAPADFIDWREQWRPAANLIREFEQIFSGRIPLPVFGLQKGQMSRRSSVPYFQLRDFAEVEAMRVRFLLSEGDLPGAVSAYQCICRINRFLLRDASLCALSRYSTTSRYQLGALQLLLESGQLPVRELPRLAGELADDENRLAGLQFRCFYEAAVKALDFADPLLTRECGNDPPGNPRERNFPFPRLRFLLPQAYWYDLRVEIALARTFRLSEFKQLPDEKDRRKLPGWETWRIPEADFWLEFEVVIGRLRAMRGLIAAEEYKRVHGDYPDAMPDLPVDPFNGKPLRYRKGICPCQVTQMNWGKYRCGYNCQKEHKFIQPETTHAEIPAIQVWSVGPDRVDNGGAGNPDLHFGDAGAMLRLKPPVDGRDN